MPQLERDVSLFPSLILSFHPRETRHSILLNLRCELRGWDERQLRPLKKKKKQKIERELDASKELTNENRERKKEGCER